MQFKFSPQFSLQNLSKFEVYRRTFLFTLMNYRWLVSVGSFLLKSQFVMSLPFVTKLLELTLFRHFCGGKTLGETLPLLQRLKATHIDAVLDYSVEAGESEAEFRETFEEILQNIEFSAKHRLPFVVFKATSLITSQILAKITDRIDLTPNEERDWMAFKDRVRELCLRAADLGLKIMVDAEETWIQGAIDQVVEEMIFQFNKERPVVFQTLQMYLKNRLFYLESLTHECQAKEVYLGIKLVRGAYLEKETEHAEQSGRPNPIHPSKPATDEAFDAALLFIFEHRKTVSLFLGTHNEKSIQCWVSLMHEFKLDPQTSGTTFCQLYGMGDHITYTLAHHGYLAAKYIPYGPVHRAIPYLMRRAQENTSIQGQTNRELALLKEFSSKLTK